MRPLPVVALPLVLLACEPLSEPSAPSAEDKPCQTNADCEMHASQSNAHEKLCGARVNAHGRSQDMDEAACGPMPAMQSSMPEPALLCFRGTCVPISKQ